MNQVILILCIVAAVVLVAAALLIVAQFRRMAVHDEPALDDELTEFKQMRDDGRISEEEYQRLRKVVATRTIAQAKQGLEQKAD